MRIYIQIGLGNSQITHALTDTVAGISKVILIWAWADISVSFCIYLHTKEKYYIRSEATQRKCNF